MVSNSSNSSDQAYLGLLSSGRDPLWRGERQMSGMDDRPIRARKISEGMPVLLGMMGRDSVSCDQQLEDQQWVVESRRFAEGQKSLGRLEQAGARRARSNVGIIAAYQKTMAEKMANAVEEREGQRRQKVVIEEMDNEEIDKEDVNKEAINNEEIDKEEMDKDEEEESLDDLPVFERQTGGRATVCLGDMKPRIADKGGKEVKDVRGQDGPQVVRSQSLRRPFRRF